jgi:protein SCO1/2
MGTKGTILLTLFLLGGCNRNPNDSNALEFLSVNAPSEPRLRKYWKIPDFELVDQKGGPFLRGTMEGKLWVVDFFYSSCPGPCPMLTSRVSEIHEAFQGDGRVGFLSISSDPEKDTPEVLSLYAKKFGADERWSFLTGLKPSIYKLAIEGFKLSLQEVVGAAEPITHSTRLVLVDSHGWVRGFYEGVGEESDGASARLIEDIRELQKELQ